MQASQGEEEEDEQRGAHQPARGAARRPTHYIDIVMKCEHRVRNKQSNLMEAVAVPSPVPPATAAAPSETATATPGTAPATAHEPGVGSGVSSGSGSGKPRCASGR